MRTKTLSTIALLSLPLLFSGSAHAMSEEMFSTHDNGMIAALIVKNKGKLDLIKPKISSTGIPVLDDLWNSRRDITDGVCSNTQNDCRVMSAFPGKSSDHPVVMLPGFTGYRKLYLEQIYDMIQAGYGPIYISDFTGTGDSYKPELQAGQSLPSINEYAAKLNPDIEPEFHQKLVGIVGETDAAQVRETLGKLPMGIGYVPHFSDYTTDINLLMALAVKENPSNKILITSLSMTGLNIMMTLADQAKHPSWIYHVDRILLESPMLRVKTTDLIIPGFGMLSELVAKIAEGIVGPTAVAQPKEGLISFIDQALGNYVSDNMISHSDARKTFTDSIRVWDGHDTAGGTFGWGYEELTHQYAVDPLDSLPFFAKPLNRRVNQIAKVLKDNNIPLVTVVSESDPLVDTKATKSFIQDITEAGADQNSICIFQTARHQIDIESDKYREPFIALVNDQKDHVVKSSYGVEPRNELLECSTIKKAPAPVDDDQIFDSN